MAPSQAPLEEAQAQHATVRFRQSAKEQPSSDPSVAIHMEAPAQAAPADALEPPISEVLYTEEEAARAVAWLCCDPFEPIPIGLQPTLVLGRSPDNDMVLPHESVSRTHAVIRVLGGGMTVEDRSTYGTLVNERRVVSQKLHPGDVLGLGPYQIVIRKQRESEPGELDTRPLRVADQSSPEAMQGRLEKVSLAEVLQTIEFNEKTGTLKVYDDDVSGILVVYEGKPMFAELGEELEDARAVYAMLRLERGNFSFISKVEAGEMTMAGKTLTGILMDFSRLQDEAQAAAGADAGARGDEDSEELLDPFGGDA